jgi:stage V sporulation protein AC
MPRTPVITNAVLAFLVGGAICALGQIVMGTFERMGLPPERAGAWTAVIVILGGAALTALGLYDEIVRVGGMGAQLPVSGFSNAVVASAMESRREGWITGVGAKMFTIAGPVIVYGVVASAMVGAVYLLLGLPLPGR